MTCVLLRDQGTVGRTMQKVDKIAAFLCCLFLGALNRQKVSISLKYGDINLALHIAL